MSCEPLSHLDAHHYFPPRRIGPAVFHGEPLAASGSSTLPDG